MFYEQAHLIYNATYIIPEKRKIIKRMHDNIDLNT